MKRKTILLGSALAMAVSACSSDPSPMASHDTPADMALSRMSDTPTMRAGGAQFTNDIFVGAARERNNAALLPASVQAAGAIHLQSRDPMTLAQIATRLASITGIPHVLALGPTGQVMSASSGADAKTASELNQAADSTNVPPPVSGKGAGAPAAAAATTSIAVPANPNTGSDSDAIRMRPNLNGSLSEVLDQIASTFDVSWTYADGRVMFRDYETRKYQITALPGSTESSVSIGANDISYDSKMSSDIWGDVTEALKGIVGPGASISISKSTGLVTVTSKVSDQNRVAEYIRQLNGVVGQQVRFDVNVFTVSLNDNSDAGLDIQAALTRGDVTAGYSGNSLMTGDVGGSVNVGIIKNTVSVNAMIKALRSQGTVSVKTRTGATTSNNRTVPIDVLQSKGYVKSIDVTTDSNGNDIASPQTDTVDTGFQMQLFPRIMNNKDIMIQFSVRVSELNDIATFGTGNNAVQLPEVSTTSFEQQAVVQNGQSLVLAGFERERAEDSKSAGLGGLLGLGGSKSKKQSRVATVLMITPHILNSSNAR